MKNTAFFRYLAYSLEIILLFILGSTPNLLPELFGAKPCLLIALGITIAVFESEVPAMFFGLACGALTDLGYSNSIGTYTIAMTLLCFIIGYCVNNLFVANFRFVLLGAVVTVTLIISLHFLFSYVVMGYEEALYYFKAHYISRIVQTIIVTLILYFVNKFIYSTLSDG